MGYISNALKVNYTLTLLDIRGSRPSKLWTFFGKRKLDSIDKEIVQIGFQGAQLLSEALKINNTLKELNISSISCIENHF